MIALLLVLQVTIENGITYIGPVPPSQEEVQDAFDTADHLVIRKGEYEYPLSGNRVFGISKSDQTVDLRGKIKLANNQVLGTEQAFVLASTAPLENWTLKGGGVLDGNRQGQPNQTWGAGGRIALCLSGQAHKRVRIEGIEVRNSISTGLLVGSQYPVKRTEEVTIRDVSIRQCGEGLLLHFVKGALVDNVCIEDINFQDGFETSVAVDVLFRGCTAKHIHTAGAGAFDIYGDSHRVLIQSSRAEGYKVAVTIGGGANSCSQIRVCDNTFPETVPSIEVRSSQQANTAVIIYDNTLGGSITYPPGDTVFVRNTNN